MGFSRLRTRSGQTRSSAGYMRCQWLRCFDVLCPPVPRGQSGSGLVSSSARRSFPLPPCTSPCDSQWTSALSHDQSRLYWPLPINHNTVSDKYRSGETRCTNKGFLLLCFERVDLPLDAIVLRLQSILLCVDLVLSLLILQELGLQSLLLLLRFL